MTTLVRVVIRPRAGVLDPQGEVVRAGLRRLGFSTVAQATVGKVVELQLDDHTVAGEALDEVVRAMCEGLLVNPIVEDYTFEVMTSGGQG